jgi:hypothetical protein
MELSEGADNQALTLTTFYLAKFFKLSRHFDSMVQGSLQE